MSDFGLQLDLGFLTESKSYTFFKPKFIFYAVYLSEKIGYARYIAIYRQLERHPELRFHPIFNWFREWCNDEFRHGEAFALLMRADPKLLRGGNAFWVKFFLLSVYATMYVRDHARPAFHEALGLDPTDYDYRVYEICSEISKQVFPLTLDIDNPKFRAGFDRLDAITKALAETAGDKSVAGAVRRLGLRLKAGLTLAGIYLLPSIPNAAPAQVRLAPAW
jgi:magnesium-protoporphyrin IX monomethyl ester (oxidative) cyclase